MTRLHVHLHVRDIAESVKFYSTLFGVAPTKREPDYAKWMLENPHVNFAISTRGEAGLSHLGIQVESEGELAAVSARAKRAAGEVLIEKGANCCYAVGDKAWAEDPQGIRWETFFTTGGLTTYGAGAAEIHRECAGDDPCCSAGVVTETRKPPCNAVILSKP